MVQQPRYSHYFSCIHDEPAPIGSLGRGTHYSVFRTAEWLDVVRQPLKVPQTHNFAVIWDEDHDCRVIEAAEKLYMAGLLSPVQFIGERKGALTVIVAARFYFLGDGSDVARYEQDVIRIAQSLEDPWPATVGSFDRAPLGLHQTIVEGLIHADEDRVVTYLRNIDSLWALGTKSYSFESALIAVA